MGQVRDKFVDVQSYASHVHVQIYTVHVHVHVACFCAGPVYIHVHVLHYDLSTTILYTVHVACHYTQVKETQATNTHVVYYMDAYMPTSRAP